MKNKVLQIIKSSIYSNKYNEINSLPNKVWLKYEEVIKDYKSGMYSSVGWYSSIVYAMKQVGLSDELAHIFSTIREQI